MRAGQLTEHLFPDLGVRVRVGSLSIWAQPIERGPVGKGTRTLIADLHPEHTPEGFARLFVAAVIEGREVSYREVASGRRGP